MNIKNVQATRFIIFEQTKMDYKHLIKKKYIYILYIFFFLS